MKEVKLLYYHPNKNNRAQGGAKILQRRDHKGEEHFHEPQFIAGKTIYVLPEDYARRLLAGQADRFFLLEPKSILVKFKSADGLSTTTKPVNSILGTPRMRQLEEALAKDAEAAKEPAKEEKKEKDPEAKVGGIHAAPDDPTAPAAAAAGQASPGAQVPGV